MTTSVDEILNGPDYFFCEHYRARMKKQACIARQENEINLRARQNPNTHLAPNLQTIGCMDCAQGAQIREEMDMASKRGICMNCGKERSLPANDKCWKCNGYGKKKMEGKHKQAGIPDGMLPEKIEMIKTKLRSNRYGKPEEKTPTPAAALDKPDPLPIASIAGLSASLLSPDPRIVILDFTVPNNVNLYEPWVKYASSHRRTPGDQAMMAIEEILTQEGLL